MCQASTCGRVLVQGPSPTWSGTVSKQWQGSQMFMSRIKTLSESEKECYWRYSKTIIVSALTLWVQQYKSARVSVLSGSVPCKMAKGRQRVSALCRNWTHVARLTTTDLHLSLSHELVYTYGRKWLVIFCNLEPIFCMQDCHSQITSAQVEYEGQTRYARNPDSRPYFNK